MTYELPKQPNLLEPPLRRRTRCRRAMLGCVLLFAGLFLAGAANGDEGIRSYPAHGVVEKIAPDLSQVTIHHQAIPGYMMEMTMGFNIRNTNELTGILPGDEITFVLCVTTNDEWVKDIHRIGHTNEMTVKMAMPMSMGDAELKAGDQLPDYALMAEDGKQIHISDFRGKALAFTFFYTRCPLPDYCPRMNNNFEQARKLLLADSGAPTNWQFLSISFDPGYDTPEVLAGYANVYRGGDADRWLFASASTNVIMDAAMHLDLMVMRMGGAISHNLRTVVLDPQGRIYREFDRNEWTPQQLAEAIEQSARSSHP